MPNQGLDLLCQVFPLILEKHPNAYAWIIGDGSYAEELREMKKGLPISMLGWVDDEELLCRHVSRSAIGLGLFTLKGNANILCADPGKIKLYAMCGLPVITTRHYKYDFGMMVDETPEALADTVDYLFSNPEHLMELRKRSYEWGRQFTTTEVMKKIQ